MCTCSENNIDINCGCKTNTNDIVYQGPPLTCLGITNCDTLTEVFSTLNTFFCGGDFANIFITNIINNPDLLEQFTEIVNENLSCDEVQFCLTSTTSTICPCTEYTFVGPRITGGTATFVECGNIEVSSLHLNNIARRRCIDNNYPIILIGEGVINNTNICCGETTTTTTTELSTTTTSTTCGGCEEWLWQSAGDNASSLEYIDCDGNFQAIPVIDVTDNQGTFCTEKGSMPQWNPLPTGGTHILTSNGCCAP